MNIKLTSYELQIAINDYLKKQGLNVDGRYTETFVKHTKTHDKNKKKMKKPAVYEFFWYAEGHEYNNEEIDIEIYVGD